VATGLHLHEPGTGGWNRDLVAARFADAPVVLVEFAWRQRGLVVAAGQEAAIRAIADLRGRRVVPRQAEAGSQALLEHLVSSSGLAADAIEFTVPARTEADAALAVAEGKADAAFGLQGLARQYRLGFVPLIRERFDLLVDRRAWFEPPLQALFDFCRSDGFRRKAEELEGYDVSGFGRVHFNG
jgi:molybdate-binding protein